MEGLTIAVLTYTRRDMLEKCLKSIVRIDPYYRLDIPYELLIVNNGGLPLRLKDNEVFHPMTRLIELPKNRGNIGGQNACFEHAKYPNVLFVSDDVELSPACAWEILSFHERFEDWAEGQIQPVLYRPDGKIDNCGLFYRYPGYGISDKSLIHSQPRIVPSICYFLRKKIWKELGGFDENLRSAYEDVDFGLRINKQYRNWLCRTAKATHYGNQTLSLTKESDFRWSRRYVIRKHYRGWDKWLRLLCELVVNAITAPIRHFTSSS